MRAAAVFRASGQNGRCRVSMQFSVIAVSFQIPFALTVVGVNGVRRLPHMDGTSSGRHGPNDNRCFRCNKSSQRQS